MEGFSQEGHHGRAPRNLGLEGCQTPGEICHPKLAAEWLEDVGTRLLVVGYANFSVEMFALSGLWVYVYVYIYDICI